MRNWRSRIWHPTARDAGVKAVPYDLRHTTASGLIYEGRPLPEIASIMGHSIEMLLGNYAHLIEDGRHAEGWSFEERIQAARAEVGTGVVHELCTQVDAQAPAGWALPGARARRRRDALGRIRTCDTRFRKPVLYPLSYEAI